MKDDYERWSAAVRHPAQSKETLANLSWSLAAGLPADIFKSWLSLVENWNASHAPKTPDEQP